MPDKIYTYDNCLTLVFKSDGSNESLGFLAEYNTTDNNVTRLDPINNCRYVYNSLGLPNVYCTVKGVAVFIYSYQV